MKQESATLVDSKHDAAEKLDPTELRRTGIVASEKAGLANNAALVTPGAKRNLRQRIKGLVENVTKALEGDHEFHNYLGG